MIRLEGMPISPGYANGLAVVYDFEIERRLELPSRSISNLEVQSECNRLDEALEASSHDLKSVEQSTLSEPRLVDSAALLSAHAAMAKEIAAIVRQHIGRELVRLDENDMRLIGHSRCIFSSSDFGARKNNIASAAAVKG